MCILLAQTQRLHLFSHWTTLTDSNYTITSHFSVFVCVSLSLASSEPFSGFTAAHYATDSPHSLNWLFQVFFNSFSHFSQQFIQYLGVYCIEYVHWRIYNYHYILLLYSNTFAKDEKWKTFMFWLQHSFKIGLNGTVNQADSVGHESFSLYCISVNQQP